jgi:hypothetical protein
MLLLGPRNVIIIHCLHATEMNLKHIDKPSFFLIYFIFLFSISTSLAQVKDLRKLASYEESLKAFHNLKWAASRKEFSQSSKKNTSQLERLDAAAQLQFQDDLLELRSKYEILKLELTLLSDQVVTSKLESNILLTAEEGHKAKEVTRLDYQTRLLNFQRQKLSEEAERRRLMISVIELERFARYNFPTDQLSYEPVPDDEITIR